MVRCWLAKQVIDRNLAALNRGDVRPTLRMYAPDARFRFPGRSTWSADITGRDQIEAWQQRMVATGLQHQADQVVAGGPLWRMTMVLRGTDYASGPDGTKFYENRYVLWATNRWGRIYDYEVYEDTEKVTGFDAYLAANGSFAAVVVPAGSAATRPS